MLALRADGESHRLWSLPNLAQLRPRLVRTTAVAVTAALICLVGFAWQLQRTDGTQLRATALRQMLRCTDVRAARGEITDRHGVPLAVDVSRDLVSTVPALVRPRDVPRLAALTARPVGGLRRLLQRHRSSLHLDVASLPTSAGRRVSEARMPGVVVIPESHRRYPRGGLLGPLLGWTGVATPDDMKRWPDLPLGAVVGRTGLEQIYDPILRGTDGRQCVYVTPAGTPARPGPFTPPRRAARCGSPSTWACSAGSPELLPPCFGACRDSPAVTSAGRWCSIRATARSSRWPACRRTTAGSSVPRCTTGAWPGCHAARRARCSST